jgi:hypothetical protein
MFQSDGNIWSMDSTPIRGSEQVVPGSGDFMNGAMEAGNTERGSKGFFLPPGLFS